MFVFCNPCARAELHQQKRARKLCSAALKEFADIFMSGFMKTVLKTESGVF